MANTSNAQGGPAPRFARGFIHVALMFAAASPVAAQVITATALPRSGGPTLSVAALDATPAERRAADYRCDGTADEVQLQAAMEQFATNGGGSLGLTSGTFLLAAPLDMAGRVDLEGQGRSTVIKAAPSFQGAALIEGNYTGVGAPIDLFTVAELVLDGSKFQGASCGGIKIEIASKTGFLHGSPDAHIALRHLLINRCTGHGVHISGSFNRAARLTGLRAWDNDGDGFRMESPDGNLTDCDAGSSGGAGFRISSANNIMVGCKAWFSDDSGFVISAVRCALTGCSSQDNARHGFEVRAGMNALAGCHADSNSFLGQGAPDAHAGLYDGFHLAASSICMSACFAYDKNEGGRGHNQRYGTFVGSGRTRLNLQVSNGNDGSHDNLTGGIGGFLTGSGTRIVATGQDEYVTP